MSDVIVLQKTREVPSFSLQMVYVLTLLPICVRSVDEIGLFIFLEVHSNIFCARNVFLLIVNAPKC